MTIKEIKDKLIELGFKLEQDKPKFNQYTGEKLPQPQEYKLTIKTYTIYVDISQRYSCNGVTQGANTLFLNLNNHDLPFTIYWNLFLQLLEKHTK